MAKRPIEIHNGFVRLLDSGHVRHWDAEISAWRPGWGVWDTRSAFGEDERKLKECLGRHRRVA